MESLQSDQLNTSTHTKVQAGATLIAASVLLSGCGIQEKIKSVTKPETPAFPPPPRNPNAETARMALSRLTFGATPGEWNRVCEMGVGGYIEEALSANREEPGVLDWRVRSLDVQSEVESSPDTLENLPDGQLLTELQQASLLRAIYSKNQLKETLADFWTNHFNIYALKNNERVLLPVDAERVVRPHVLGKFRDLLTESAHSPAMLSFLDNQLNRKGVANENYARELLELHTLGVKSGYTQKDIQEVARCFTGWRVKGGGELTSISFAKQPSQYKFDAEMHDNGAKFIPFLNLHLTPNRGKGDAESVLEALSVSPTTARFLAKKLCRRYLGEAPEAIVQRASNAYLKSDTDIRALLRPILLDGLLGGNADSRKPILKRPLDFMVSSLRALSADTDGGENLQVYLQNMGQPLYQWPMPDGYPTKEAAWTGSLLGRWNYALALTANKIGGTQLDLAPLFEARGAKTPEQKAEALTETILLTKSDSSLIQPLRRTLTHHIENARRGGIKEEQVVSEITALIFASPEFQRG